MSGFTPVNAKIAALDGSLPVDSSDYILITTKLLEEEGILDETRKSEIVGFYFDGRYDDAIRMIHGLIDDAHRLDIPKSIYNPADYASFSDTESLASAGAGSASSVSIASEDTSEDGTPTYIEIQDSPTVNFSRRYFEARCADDFLKPIKEGQRDEDLFTFLNFLQEQLTNAADLYKRIKGKTITQDRDFKKAQPLIDKLRTKYIEGQKWNNDDRNAVFTAMIFATEVILHVERFERKLKSEAPIYTTKDRDNHDLVKRHPNEKHYSKHPSVMHKNQATPRDVQTETLATDKKVDVGVIRTDMQERGFSSTHKHIPFTNSLSGTSFQVSAWAHYYLKETERKGGDIDAAMGVIETMYNSWRSLAVSAGYHSQLEIVAAFNTDPIKDLYSKIGIEPRWWIDEAALAENFKQAASYATTSLNRDRMHKALTADHGVSARAEAASRGRAPVLAFRMATSTTLIEDAHEAPRTI